MAIRWLIFAFLSVLLAYGQTDNSAADSPAKTAAESPITAPPKTLGLGPFYKKAISADGYPIVASERVSDYALREAAYLVSKMLAQRPDVRDAMIAGGSRLVVMAHDEFTTDVPEHAHLTPRDYWDARARGLGGSETDPVCSCAEENLLGYPGDPYSSECILIHEFAHNIHLRGMVAVDATFDERVQTAYRVAVQERGLWQDKYASTNHHEYFAEGVQSWFGNNRENDHDHNHVNTREELLEYDDGLANLCREVFGETELVYSKPDTRLEGHLSGYDPALAPRFEWPARLRDAQKKIRAEAESRDTGLLFRESFEDGDLAEHQLFAGDDWRLVEAMFQLNTLDATKTTTNADGVARGWVDGEFVIDRTDLVFRSPDLPEMKFNQFLLLPYFGPGLLPGEQALWIDDLELSSRRLATMKGNEGRVHWRILTSLWHEMARTGRTSHG